MKEAQCHLDSDSLAQNILVLNGLLCADVPLNTTHSLLECQTSYLSCLVTVL